MLTGSAEYARTRRRTQLAGTAQTAFRYYQGLNEIESVSHTAGLGANFRLPRTASFRVNQSAAYSPSYLYQLFPAAGPDVGRSDSGAARLPRDASRVVQLQVGHGALRWALPVGRGSSVSGHYDRTDFARAADSPHPPWRRPARAPELSQGVRRKVGSRALTSIAPAPSASAERATSIVSNSERSTLGRSRVAGERVFASISHPRCSTLTNSRSTIRLPVPSFEPRARRRSTIISVEHGAPPGRLSGARIHRGPGRASLRGQRPLRNRGVADAANRPAGDGWLRDRGIGRSTPATNSRPIPEAQTAGCDLSNRRALHGVSAFLLRPSWPTRSVCRSPPHVRAARGQSGYDAVGVSVLKQNKLPCPDR